MHRSVFHGKRAALPAGSALLAALLGCGEASPPAALSAAPAPLIGTLAMPLATIVNGIRYRLTRDVFLLSGREDPLQHNGDGTLVYATLPAGDYEVTLQDGWALERQAEEGFEPVVAELVSPNPRAFRIESDDITHVAWIFQTDGTPVNLEPPGLFQGDLAVADSSNPATAIFGDVLVNEPPHVAPLAGIASIDGRQAVLIELHGPGGLTDPSSREDSSKGALCVLVGGLQDLVEVRRDHDALANPREGADRTSEWTLQLASIKDVSQRIVELIRHRLEHELGSLFELVRLEQGPDVEAEPGGFRYLEYERVPGRETKVCGEAGTNEGDYCAAAIVQEPQVLLVHLVGGEKPARL